MQFHIPTATKEVRGTISVLTDIVEAAKNAFDANEKLDPGLVRDIIARIPIFYGMYLEGVCQIADEFGKTAGDIVEILPTVKLE